MADKGTSRPKRREGRERREAPWGLGSATQAFTLIELLVAMTILCLLGVLLLSMVGNISSLSKRSREQVESFQGARTGFEALTRNLSQATLNTYWDYYDSASNSASSASYNGTPAKYDRQSELHFRSGPCSNMLTPATPANYPTHAVFFQIPGGYSATNTLKTLTTTLNAVGFFIEFGSDKSLRPDFLSNSTSINDRNRYRLMQMQQPTESLQIYSTNTGTAWFTNPLSSAVRPVNVLAENVVALVIVPKLSETEDPSNVALVRPDYNYDSRATNSYLATPASGPPLSGTTLHQLPPLVEVIMVAIDETSAQRAAAINGTNAPDFGQSTLFTTNVTSYAGLTNDLNTLENTLRSRGMIFRTYRTVVGIRGAKWSK
jgi:uncharacterized protein (TIGR02599 family)